jgi:ferrous iron transport protein B
LRCATAVGPLKSSSPLYFHRRAGAAYLGGLVSALAVVGIALLGVFLTFAVSWGLSRTVLRGEVSTFSLELPPYRPPRIWQTIYTSLIDRTIFVLWRAIVFALPAGAVIWLAANITIGGTSIAEYLISYFESGRAAAGTERGDPRRLHRRHSGE